MQMESRWKAAGILIKICQISVFSDKNLLKIC